jgi:beta-phosphoglucomutase-like phosphatase (HAD superfamily)
MRCELVIFDCDGVLVDSELILNRAPCRGHDGLRLPDRRG